MSNIFVSNLTLNTSNRMQSVSSLINNMIYNRYGVNTDTAESTSSLSTLKAIAENNRIDTSYSSYLNSLQDSIESLNKQAASVTSKIGDMAALKSSYTKTATTLDGKIALSNGLSKWITNEKARKFVHKLRSEYQAIMSASGTILADNPQLNVRLKNKKSPIRIIFDPNNKIPLDFNVFNNDGNRIILINNSEIKLPNHIEQIDFDGNFNNLFKKLYEIGIFSIMIEAGCGFNSELLKSNEVDEINLFMAPKIFGGGLNFVDGLKFKEINEAIQLENIKIKQFDDNFLINSKIKK